MATQFTDGGGDHKWSTVANWSDGKPDTSDDVTVAGTVTSIIIDESCYFQSLDLTGAGAGLTLTISGTPTIWAKGSVTLKSGMTWTANAFFSCEASVTLDTNGVTMTSTMVRVRSGTFTLINNNLSCTSLSIFQTSSIVTNNLNITLTGSFTDSGQTGTVTLTLGSSTINCANVSFTAATLTVSTNTATINIGCTADTTTNFNNVDWDGTTVNITYSPTTADNHAINFTGTSCVLKALNIALATDRRDCTVAFNNNFSLDASSTWKGGGVDYDNPTIRLLIKSSAPGTARTVAFTAGSQTLTLTDVDMQDITVDTANSPTITGTRVGDCGGNTNCDVDAAKTVYALTAITTDWYSNIWEASRGGGVSLNNYPLPQDTAIIDDATWDGTGHTLYVSGVRIGVINASSLTEANTFLLVTGTYYGSLDFTGSGVTVTSTGYGIYFDARVATTLNVNRNGTIGSGNVFIQSYGGTVQLSSAFTHTGTFTLTQGTLELNGQVLTTNTFSSSNSNTRTIQDTAGGGGIVVKGLTGTIFDISTDTSLTLSNAPDITIGDSASPLTYTGNVTAIFGSISKTFGDLRICDHAGDYSINIQRIA